MKYEMTQEQFDKLLDSSKPVPYMVFGGREPTSPQENANRAWAALGEEMGFQPITVRPYGNDPKFFTANPVPRAVDKNE